MSYAEDSIDVLRTYTSRLDIERDMMHIEGDYDEEMNTMRDDAESLSRHGDSRATACCWLVALAWWRESQDGAR